ncbi:MAG: 2-oxoglutarate dehydrogenase complex dihydrolipoyllysine-residue succinyltransferase [Gammaproteobacteria bacterium]
MTADVTVPAFPESVSDGTIAAWRKQVGQAVKQGEVLADIETDKVVFEVPATQDGVLQEIVAGEGTTVVAGQVIARLGNGAAAKTSAPSKTEAPPVMPAAKRALAERGSKEIPKGSGKGGRVLKEDVERADLAPTPAPLNEAKATTQTPAAERVELPFTALTPGERLEKRVPMTRLRARVAERLVEAQRTAAILTTFNEINMHAVIDARNRYRDEFERTHGVRLGFMSFFVRACVEALKRFPEVNASIDGHDVVYHGYYDIGIAVASPRGLVVPILRDADRLDMAAIESRIKEYGSKAQAGSLALADLTGGTFTITNGGVFGSLLSTPILNPPQSAILGMHKIEERPVAEDGKVVIRPMMYVALSYDHRLIDGREAVQFLVTVKELLEDPARLLLGV